MASDKALVREIVTATWWLGAVVSLALLLSIPLRMGNIDFSRRSPFDNTRSGHAEQWRFLNEAAFHVPRGATFSVLAPDGDTEMSLFMMAVGLLPEASPLPSSYYGKATAVGDLAGYVLEMDGRTSEQPPGTRSTTIKGGRVTTRQATPP
jgi:hypothetical protein